MAAPWLSSPRREAVAARCGFVERGGVGRARQTVASRVVLWKNSTFTIVPSGSATLAVRLTVAGRRKPAVRGLVRLTPGATFGRSGERDAGPRIGAVDVWAPVGRRLVPASPAPLSARPTA